MAEDPRIDRIHGLQAWESRLEGRLPPQGVVRKAPDDVGTDDKVRKIGFRDDTRARVPVTGSDPIAEHAER